MPEGENRSGRGGRLGRARELVCIYGTYIYMQRCRRIYITFSFAPYISLFSLDKKLKQKLFIPHVFFYKEVYLLIVIF